MEDGTIPAYAKEMAQDLIMFVGTRGWFMIIWGGGVGVGGCLGVVGWGWVFFFSFKVPQTGKRKRERGVVCCSRLVGGDVEGGENSSLFLALWNTT